MTNDNLLIALKVASLPRTARQRAYLITQAGFEQVQTSRLTREIPAFDADFSIEEEIIKDCQKFQINCLSYLDSNYPLSTDTFYDMPPVLFVRGETGNLVSNSKNIAIVGSRNADRFGLDLTKQLATELAEHIAITSGLALGIDSAAHQGALLSKLPANCIAVLAHGLDQVYPRSNQRLANKILDTGGCLVSQFAPGIAPLPHQFLIRNATIAALAQAVLVIQAGLRSGSLATARHALENGKDVLAIPGRIDDARFDGTNRLIQQGAHLVRNASDIFAILGIENSPQLDKHKLCGQTQISPNAQLIVETLKQQGPLHYLELLEQLAQTERLHEEILQLELDGILQRKVGNYLSLNAGKNSGF